MTTQSASIVVSNLSHGGAVRAYVLAQSLIKLGFRVTVVGVASGELYVAPPPEIPIIAVPLDRGNPLKRLLSAIVSELVIAVKPRLSSYGVALAKRKLSGGKVILDIDDSERSWRSRPKLWCRFPLYDTCIERFSSGADAVTTTSSHLQKRYGGVLLPNGNDTDLFDPARCDGGEFRKRWGLEGKKIVLFAGAARPHKGVEDAVEAVRLLNREDVRLVVLGPAPYDQFHEQLKNSAGGMVIVKPPVPFALSPQVLAAADVVVIPQRDTPTSRAQVPLKLSAAMSMACPIITTRVGDIPAVAADTAAFCSPGRPAELAEQLRRLLLNSEEARSLGARARERCKMLYSTDVMASILAELLAKLGRRNATA